MMIADAATNRDLDQRSRKAIRKIEPESGFVEDQFPLGLQALRKTSM